MHISLTPELEHFVNSKIQSGMYSNVSEVIRDALRHMYNAEERQQVERLRAELAVGLTQAENGQLLDYDMEDIAAEAKAEYEAGKTEVNPSVAP